MYIVYIYKFISVFIPVYYFKNLVGVKIFFLRYDIYKGTVGLISNDPICKDNNFDSYLIRKAF